MRKKLTSPARKAFGRGRLLRVPVPKTRDPFINAKLISLGKDRAGVERFWISTWNDSVGCLGVVVSESGDSRVFRFPRRFPGFYSAAPGDPDTLWLVGQMDKVVRLDLSTGRHECFQTGLAGSLVFSGMPFDPETGKLFFLSFSDTGIVGCSFDTRARRPAKVYRDFTPDHYLRCSFASGDGTWSVVVQCPGESLLHWDPKRETLDTSSLTETLDLHGAAWRTYRLIADDAGRVYFPGRGWFEPKTRNFAAPDVWPETEMCWFARRDTLAWGARTEGAHAHVSVWDMKTGKVRHLCTIPDGDVASVNLTASGKIICVNTYGVFHLFDAATGALEVSSELPTDSIGRTDCVVRIDRRRLLGTAFITQRFWEADVRTGKGFDCGRAAPGGGQIALAWKIRDKVYMAAYTGGELVEYDPAEHPHFPENPRVVAKPPRGMRPVAGATDGTSLFYACSSPYGTLGSTLTRYDTRAGRATYAVNPLPDQQVRSLCYDRASDSLLSGTTIDADCASCPPTAQTCLVARIRARDLSVVASRPAPRGFRVLRVVGPLAKNTWLATLGQNCWNDGDARWFALDGDTLDIPPGDKLKTFPDGLRRIVFTGHVGRFLLLVGERVELWDMREHVRLASLARFARAERLIVQDDSLYITRPREVVILENSLKGLG